VRGERSPADEDWVDERRLRILLAELRVGWVWIRLLTQIEELLLQDSALAPHFQCILGKDGPLDTLTVTVEPAATESVARAEAAALHVAERVKSNIGVTIAVHVLASGTIERSTGKMRQVIDERGG
jgi:phenylacetate-CoA ligase